LADVLQGLRGGAASLSPAVRESPRDIGEQMEGIPQVLGIHAIQEMVKSLEVV
jgi:hypothetical protein